MIATRIATPDDAEAIACLLTELGYPTEADALPDRMAAMTNDGGTVVVGFENTGNHQILGVASGARIATLHAGGHVAYITALVTSEQARGRGVGRALVTAIETWAREQGCSRLSVTSAEHRADAHAFYPRCGLPFSGRRFSKTL